MLNMVLMLMVITGKFRKKSNVYIFSSNTLVAPLNTSMLCDSMFLKCVLVLKL